MPRAAASRESAQVVPLRRQAGRQKRRKTRQYGSAVLITARMEPKFQLNPNTSTVKIPLFVLKTYHPPTDLCRTLRLPYFGAILAVIKTALRAVRAKPQVALAS